MIAIGDGWLMHLGDGKMSAATCLDDALHVDTTAPPTAGWFANSALQKSRHNGNFNIWFCDGHLEFFRTDTLISREDEKLRRWNNDNLPHRDLVY